MLSLEQNKLFCIFDKQLVKSEFLTVGTAKDFNDKGLVI